MAKITARKKKKCKGNTKDNGIIKTGEKKKHCKINLKFIVRV